MKKQNRLKILFGLMILTVAGCWLFNQSKEIPLSELALENVEALANGEGHENYGCIGDGEIDCYGMKVAIRVDGLR